ncbi:hypothetical protein [Pseudomarimonas arenosa]|uniref:Transmembrane protein n=1 Tax=Pseudomarimonas arenosa TaxID=2774145 RepID=A0AAW3ZJS2_9GAMM|nr:hypothetical protein [Pseudomarimonas arenosa]MBD8524541.1 hypothetical protein [Pseudomarimonas arenosa]
MSTSSEVLWAPLSLRPAPRWHELLSHSQLVSIAVTVLVLHLLGVFWLWSLMRPSTGATDTESIQVQWLAADPRRELPVPPMPRPPLRAVSAAPSPVITAERREPSETAQAQDVEPVSQPPASRWLTIDGTPRWDRSAIVASGWTDQDRIVRDRLVQLPGHSDSAAAEKVAIRLRRAMTPEDVVGAVLRFLFGRVAKDDCRAIERRLHMSDPGITREIDLHKFRKQCAS